MTRVAFLNREAVSLFGITGPSSGSKTFNLKIEKYITIKKFTANKGLREVQCNLP